VLQQNKSRVDYQANADPFVVSFDQVELKNPQKYGLE
jgi:hypothetical protein